MKSIKRIVFAYFAVVIFVCCGCSTPNRSQIAFSISNTGEEIVELHARFPDRAAVIHLGQQGIRSFPVGTVVVMGDSSICVTDTRIEVAHTGEDVVTLNYVDSLGNDKTMVLGNGGTGFFHNPKSITIEAAQLHLVGS